jgi:hypothetical protein
VIQVDSPGKQSHGLQAQEYQNRRRQGRKPFPRAGVGLR